MTIDSVDVIDSAILFCRFQFIGELKDGKLEKEQKIRLKFKKEKNEWKVKESEKLQEFFN